MFGPSPLTPEQVDVAADALDQGLPVAILLDDSGIYLVLVPTPDRPHEVDFFCVGRSADGFRPHALSATDHTVLVAWTEITVPAVCQAWNQRHPLTFHPLIPEA